ncbi:MAG: hypothetical protein QNJ09_09820 [Paracoccaceae bacterium]|nr:hypothetical protein [Paracoccaceae bacterium]
MIDPTPFVKALGPRLAHVTAATNLPGIERHGLLPAAQLAQKAGGDHGIALRDHRLHLRGADVDARLNHQKPILRGLKAANRIVDGHDAESWAEQLDQRVFFWPETRGNRFRASIARDVALHVLWFDTVALIERHSARLYLSPINSGNFTQGGAHARRGDWLYVPLQAGMDAFRQNRRARGLVKSKDSVAEISLLGALQAEDVAALRITA